MHKYDCLVVSPMGLSCMLCTNCPALTFGTVFHSLVLDLCGPCGKRFKEGLLTNVQEYIHITTLCASLTSNSHSLTYILGQ